MTDMAALPYLPSDNAAPAASPAPDHPYQLAGVIFDITYIADDHVRPGRGGIDDTAETIRKRAVAAARPRGKARGENLRRRRNRNHGDIRIAAAHRLHYGARDVGDDGTPDADIAIDRARQSIA